MSPAPVSLGAAARVWAKIGCLSFGGPAGQIALMHDELVVRRRWLDEGRFLHALNYCMLLPGPEAQQLATYIGWLLHRRRGGLIAGALFVLPGFALVLGLAAAYVTWRELGWVAGLLFGLKAAVLALVAGALARIGGRALRRPAQQAIAVAAFAAIAIAGVPFPIVVAGAAAVGLLVHRLAPAAPPAPPPPMRTTVQAISGSARSSTGSTHSSRAVPDSALLSCAACPTSTSANSWASSSMRTRAGQTPSRQARTMV